MGVELKTRQSREATVREHMEAENAHEFERCIAAFAHPRYEIVATGEVWDGHGGVNALLQENKKGFPDFRFHPRAFHHADDAVVVEGRFTGTHLGSWRGLPATKRKVDFPLIIVFQFEGDDLVCERTYFYGYRVGDRTGTAEAGETVVCPVGVAHSQWNAGAGVMRILYEHRPALESAELFFETYFGLSREGRLLASGDMRLLQAAVLLTAVADFVRITSPPRFVQIAAFPALAAIGRARGLRARYARFASDQAVEEAR